MLGLILALPPAFLLLLWLGQRRLIYIPLTPSVTRVTDVVPRASEALLSTEDGLDLRGWFVPAQGGSPAATVVVFNGNAGSRQDRLPLATALARRGLSVLLFDYRGYGGNGGAPTESGLIRDARAARAWLDARPDVDAGRIVYYGESLGAAVAVALAVERPPAALVLRSPFTSLVDAARVHYPWLPVRWMLRDRWDSMARMPRVTCPLLVIAGEEDSIVPHDQSRRLFETAAAREKRFFSVPGADHNDAELTAGERLAGETAGFLSETVGAARGAD